MLFAPELFLLLGSLVLFFITLGENKAGQAKGAAIAIAVVNLILVLATQCQEGNLFYDAYRVDCFSQFFKVIISIGFLVFLLFGRALKGVEDKIKPEYYLFMLLSVMGLVMLMSSVELLTMVVSLELSSFCLYLLVPMRDEHTGERTQMEGAIKYILFGVLATAIMLFGMSYIFGLTNTTYLVDLLPALNKAYGMNQVAVIAGLAMVMIGFLYKLGVFPLHFWVPDVYQGASNETAAFIASVPKIAAVAILIRITTLVAPGDQTMPVLLTVLAVGSMFYGNLLALVQKDIKRMLGFSGIAHAGFIMLGLVTFKTVGFAAAVFYIIGYLVMTLTCFLVICKVSQNGENVLIEDLTGLHKRAPLLALTLGIGMFALAGIPPFAGFMGKFMLLTHAYANDHKILVVLAAINTAIAIYYYLSVVRVTFCSDPEEKPAIQVDVISKVVSVGLLVVIILLGVLPNGLLQSAEKAINTLPGAPFL